MELLPPSTDSKETDGKITRSETQGKKSFCGETQAFERLQGEQITAESALPKPET
jgi:hypothetical protein